MRHQKPSLRHCNNLLTVIVIGVALYIFVSPFLPRAQLYVTKATDKTKGYAYANNFTRPVTATKPIPTDNRLVIPAIELDQPINEGDNIAVINNGGTWHRPRTASPSTRGNTVIIAHRYTYQGASTFYNLDRLRAGDPIIVYWHGKEYDYRVRLTKVTPPSDQTIEAPSDTDILTLYTCTPLWNAKNRLVVVAEPLKAGS